MKKVVLSISFFALFIGTASPMSTNTQNNMEEAVNCLTIANSVMDALELIGVSDGVAFRVAEVVYYECQAQN